MIYGAEIDELIESWMNRIGSSRYSADYKDGVRDCLYELKNLVTKDIEDQQHQLSLQHADAWYS